MNFWKEHVGLRVILIAVFFAAGMLMVFGGWKMTGKMAGLGIMLLGVALLLAALMIYNKRYQD